MISVVIPVYNELDWTKQCLENLKLFIEEDYEVIIVDDGSTDGTQERIVERNIKNLKYFRFDKNRGVTAARNKGVLESSGEYIMVINNDIKIISPNTIRIMKHLSDTHMLACPSFYRKYSDDLYSDNGRIGMTGFFYMFRKDKSLFPIDPRLKIFYNDNRLFHAAKKSIGRGGTIRHYESQTVNSKKKNRKQDKANYQKVTYWMQEDGKTWEKILSENGREDGNKLQENTIIAPANEKKDADQEK